MKNGEPVVNTQLDEMAPPRRPHHVRLKRTTFVVLLLVLFFFVLSTGVSIWRQYEHAWEKVEFEAQSAAMRLDRWLVYPLRFFDALPLETLAQSTSSEEKFFNQIIERSHRFYGVRLVDSNGNTVRSFGRDIKSEPPKTWNNLPPAKSGFLQFGRSFYEDEAETWLMPVRHLHFIGENQLTAIAYMDGRAFEAIFKALHPEGNGSLAIFRNDGLMLARIPYTDKLVGQSFAEGELFSELLPAHPKGISRAPRGTDGIERIVAHHSLAAYPLIITVGLDINGLLNQTLQTLVSQNIAFLGVFVVALLFAYILWHQVKSVEEAQKDLMETQEKLHRLASRDPLTNCFNRRAFLQKAEVEKARIERHGGAFSCIMIDLDNFKRINDTRGHQVGDTVLSEFVTLCNRNLRTLDFIGRFGGEEFVILLPETPIEPTLEVAERIRQELNLNGLECPEGNIPLTFSAGIASLKQANETVEELLKRADDALYKAKHEGRNRILAAQTES